MYTDELLLCNGSEELDYFIISLLIVNIKTDFDIKSINIFLNI